MDKYLDLSFYFEKSQVILQHQSPKIAKLLLTRALKNPDSSQNQQIIYRRLAFRLFSNDYYSESLMPWKRLCVVSPREWENWLNLISSLLAVEKTEQALYFLKKALILHPNISNLHLNLLNVLQRLKRLNEIEEIYQWISGDLKSNRLVGELYFKAGEVFRGSERGSQAVSHYKRAVETCPAKHMYRFNFSIALYHQRLFKEALTQFEHCLRINPKDKNSINNIAFIYYNLGNIQISLDILKEILEKKLETHGTYFNFILINFHLDGSGHNAKEISKHKWNLRSIALSYGSQLRRMYKTELQFAEIERKAGPDKQAKNFISKKIKSLNYILSIIRELQLTP